MHVDQLLAVLDALPVAVKLHYRVVRVHLDPAYGATRAGPVWPRVPGAAPALKHPRPS